MREKMVSAGVILLNLHRRPSAILRRIISIVVDSINGVFLAGLISHIVKEVLKRMSPPITNGDSTTTVVREPFVFFSVAPVPHARPRSVFSGAVHAVNRVFFSYDIVGVATAGGRFSCSEAITSHGGDIPAIADTLPHLAFPARCLNVIWGAFYNSKFTEFLTSKVDELRHDISSVWISVKRSCGKMVRFHRFRLQSLPAMLQ
jgi:hypothetical protein